MTQSMQHSPIQGNHSDKNLSRGRVIACWAIHFYTSLGLPINLFSLWALTQGNGRLFFGLNLLAVCDQRARPLDCLS